MERYIRSSIDSFRITCIEDRSLDQLIRALDVHHFIRYEIDSRSINCKHTLLSAFTKGFNLHEGMFDSWDATADLIWQRLTAQSSARAALIWYNTQLLLADNLQLFLDGLDLLLGVDQLTRMQKNCDGLNAVDLQIFLVGNGPNFSSFRE